MISITRNNLFKLISRSAIFLIFFIFAVFHPIQLIQFFNFQISYFKIYHLVWLVFALMLLKELFIVPKNISSGKIYATYFYPNKNLSLTQSKTSLDQLTKKYNKGALNAAIFWLTIIAILLVGYFAFGLSKLWIFGFVIFASMMDIICITLWCPFRNWIVKNKCCNACRIYHWSYWMEFIPLIVIPSFWSYSLVFLSILIFFKWEYMHYKHPERFYEKSNLNLVCRNCKNPSG